MINAAAKHNVRWYKAAAVLLSMLFGLMRSYAAGVDYNEVMVNNVWVDVPLTQVFRDISVETGVILATCPHVTDQLISLDAGSGRLLDECLVELVAGRGLFVYPKNKKFYLIGCGDSSCPSFMEVADSSRIYLKYVTAKHLKTSLPKSVQEYISSGERPNEVLLYATPEISKRIMEIIAKLDVPQPQVVLEVLVVELWEDASREFGLDWKYERQGVSAGITQGLEIFTGIAGYTNVPAEQFTNLLLTLKMLVGEGKASIRSRPRVATLNGEKATIDISLDEYFSIVTDSGYYSSSRSELQIIKSGVLLEITPHIGDKGDITVDVLTEVSDVASRQSRVTRDNSGNLPVIRRRKANTCVRVKEGDAIVLGGLIETREQSSVKKVPVLGDTPLIGGLFTSKSNTSEKKEMVIFITPRLMKDAKDPLASRNKMISIEEELKDLRELVGMLGGENQADANSSDTQDRTISSEHHDLPNVNDELHALKDTVVLLDAKNKPGQSPPDIKENEPVIKN
jgi:type II secretory pathway component HofQ